MGTDEKDDIILELVRSIQLILVIDSMGATDNPEVVKLCPGSRKQLQEAVKHAGYTHATTVA